MGKGKKTVEMKDVSGPSVAGECLWTGLESALAFHHRAAESLLDTIVCGYSFPPLQAANLDSQWTLTEWFVLHW